jgi:hypothetical protein
LLFARCINADVAGSLDDNTEAWNSVFLGADNEGNGDGPFDGESEEFDFQEELWSDLEDVEFEQVETDGFGNMVQATTDGPVSPDQSNQNGVNPSTGDAPQASGTTTTDPSTGSSADSAATADQSSSSPSNGGSTTASGRGRGGRGAVVRHGGGRRRGPRRAGHSHNGKGQVHPRGKPAQRGRVRCVDVGLVYDRSSGKCVKPGVGQQRVAPVRRVNMRNGNNNRAGNVRNINNKDVGKG